MHIYSLRTLYSHLITLTPEIFQNSDYQPIPHNLRTIASTCLQLCWDFMMGVLECSGTMWCYTSIDFICRGLNQFQLCTVWARNKKWLAFYPYVWDQSCHKLIRLLCCGWDSFSSCAQEGSMIEQLFLVVCCMWRQYLTEPWLICLSPWSHLFPRDWTIYARGPRHVDFVKCWRHFGHIFLVWYHHKEISFIHFTWTGITIVCLHGVWCLRGSG